MIQERLKCWHSFSQVIPLSIRAGKIIYSFIITARMNFCCRIAIEFYFLFAYFHLFIDNWNIKNNFFYSYTLFACYISFSLHSNTSQDTSMTRNYIVMCFYAYFWDFLKYWGHKKWKIKIKSARAHHFWKKKVMINEYILLYLA